MQDGETGAVSGGVAGRATGISVLAEFMAVAREVNRLLLHVETEQGFFEGVCRAVLQMESIALAWVGVIRPGCYRVIPVAQAGGEADYLEEIEVTWDDSAQGKGPTGRAVKTQQPQIVQCTATAPCFGPWRGAAQKRGFSSTAAIPLLYEGETVGALNLYSVAVDRFDDATVEFLTTVAAGISLGLKAIQATGEKRQAEGLSVALAELTQAIISPVVANETMYQMILDRALVFTDSEHGFVASIDAASRAHVSHTLTKMRTEGCKISGDLHTVPIEGKYPGLWGASLNNRTAFFTNRPMEHPDAQGLPEGHVPLKNFLSVPVMFGGEVLGQIALANSTRDYQPSDLAVIERLGEIFAVVLHNRKREEALQAAAEALTESEERLRLFMEYSPVYVFFKDEEIRPVLLSANFAAWLGKPMEEILGKTMDELFPPDLAANIIADDQRVLREGKPITVVEELGGKVYVTNKFPIARKGKSSLVAGFTMDITEGEMQRKELAAAHEELEKTNRQLRDANAQLTRMATMDQLTGAANRWHFLDVIVPEMKRAQRYHYPLSILALDLDRFKRVNDECGHEAGDQVLVQLVWLVQRHIRTNDVLARWGGEEFIILAPHLIGTEAMEMAEKIRRLVQEQVLPPCAMGVTVSIGVAEWWPGEGLNHWIKRADDALYAAKAAGRNRVVLAPGVDKGES